MKKNLSLFLALLLLLPLVCLASAEDDVFLRIDRDDPDAWQKPLDNVRFLDEVCMSGSAQFSVGQFEELAKQLREHAGDREIWIVDCRMETHGFINGIAVSWCNADNNANTGKTVEQIEAEEAALTSLEGATVTAYTTANDQPVAPVMLTAKTWQTEREIVETAGFHYLRLPCPDHGWPPADVIDAFLPSAREHLGDAWMHFHCQAGSGRTGAFMTIDEMLQMPEAALEEILQHQAETGSGNLLTPAAPEKTHVQKCRYVMVRAFCRWLRSESDGTWGEWLADHSAEVRLAVGDSLDSGAVITSDALIVDETGKALTPGLATVLSDDALLTVTVADAEDKP